MENIIKKAFDRVKADENIKQKTIEYILNTESAGITVRRKPLYLKRLAAAACAAVILLALPIGAYAFYKTPTSYVSVDINPSVELGINAFGKVVTVMAYNADGEKVIDGLSLVNSNVQSAVRQIVKSASQNGFIKDDGSTFIAVTAETNDMQQAGELEQDAFEGAEDAIESEDDTATIETGTIALDRRNEAIALGITPGKLNLIQKLQSLDPAIKTEDYKDASVSEIQKKFVELKKEHNGVNDQYGTGLMTSPGPSPAPSPSPSASPNPSPAEPDKPGNGNNNGNNNGSNNGNKKDDVPPVSESSGVDPSAPAHGKNGNNENSGSSNNDKDKEQDKDKENNGKGNGA